MEPITVRTVVLAGHRGDPAPARAGLAEGGPEVRSVALGALGRLGALTAADLDAGLADADPVVRRRAAEEAGRHPELSVALVPALADVDDRVVEAAAWACGERGTADPVTLTALTDLVTDHADPLCREAAVAALGAIGEPATVEAVLAATNDKPAVRRRAVIALAAFEGDNVDAALQHALEDRDRQVRQAAEDLLAEPGA